MMDLAQRERYHLFSLDAKLKLMAKEAENRILEVWKMTVYTFITARQRLAHFTDEANRKTEIIIERKNRQMFEPRPAGKKGSGLDVQGVDAQLSTNELVDMIRELREERA
uniref:Uncharacterized protein n=1 Tax=Candidatus Kentrum sp. LPFa TaxID=2126335 RepID=A0A450VZM4_9GAMM|nr:MAG: hypothetical protein BECKLPF1236B_GA0070989_101321 [Candidatus Kentron sp. LPFa]